MYNARHNAQIQRQMTQSSPPSPPVFKIVGVVFSRRRVGFSLFEECFFIPA